MEGCEGKGCRSGKGLIDQRELKDQYKGAEASGRGVWEWRMMLKGGESSLQLVRDELASGMQRSEPGKCQGLFCFRFNAEFVPIKGEVGAALRPPNISKGSEGPGVPA